MATREEISLLHAARAGEAAAQLALGKRYLFGGKGLPKNPATALYWLDRAAAQQERDAWLLIGSHVPFEIARQVTHVARLSQWYERAYDSGMPHAGLVFAKLVLQQPELTPDPNRRIKALEALEAAARAGIPDAQWMLAQQATLQHSARGSDSQDAASAWLYEAACNGVPQAQRRLAEECWKKGDVSGFLQWTLPLAHDVARRIGTVRTATSAEDSELLSRCAQALYQRRDMEQAEQMWEAAAAAGHREAQYRLGLWIARMDESGERLPQESGAANYKRAIKWLSSAAEQGHGAAWHALSRIYWKAECSQRSLADALQCLERAALAGIATAQLEWGKALWRMRRATPGGDVYAASWLIKAEEQGIEEAGRLLERIVPRAQAAVWADAALKSMSPEELSLHPFMAARLKLAAAFGLNRAEAVLIDVQEADAGACLVVDISKHRPRSRRRMIQIRTAAERQILNEAKRLFEQVDCGPAGPEGNYRQRLYRLRALSKAADMKAEATG
jgi:TPR repeat protein